jgi:hypothetical protein
MIVTADPVGDFNATSQILRYSALAREVTVPRIPSVTSQILAQSASSGYFSNRSGCGRGSPTDTERETMEIAALEIARMSEEIDGLRSELLAEQERRIEIEAHLESAREELEERILEKEAEVREECYLDMEKRFQQEIQRWKTTWESEAERGEEHLDKKLEILTRGIGPEDDDKENAPSMMVNEDLEDENLRLRREVEVLTRQLQGRSPSKKSGGPLRELSGLGREMERLRVSGESTNSIGSSRASPGPSPLKKVRKLTARKWDLMDEGEML